MRRTGLTRAGCTLPAFELLEERIMLAAQPVVAIQGGGDVQLGESTTITLTFDNQPDGSPGSNVGYAPYIDLVLPQNGADGAGVGSLPPAENDGITFAGATYLGQPVASTVLEFDANGEAVHPFARDATGALRVVRAADYGATAGDQLVVLTLPYGSFTPDQTPASVVVSLDLSNLADIDTPLPLSAVGGFAFGRDALNNPTTDPPVLGPVATTSITPTLATLSKSFSGADGETVTGPNFPQFYLLSVDLATGQTVTDVLLRDTLPDGIVVTGTSIVAGPAGTIALDPLTNDLTVRYAGPSVGVAGIDAQIRVDFYVGEFLAPGQPATPVLDPATGAPRGLANDLSITGTWQPLDPRDPITTGTIDPTGPENVFAARAYAVQKTATVVGGGAPEPGDTIRWTITSQVSDYFSITDLTLTDQLSDGQLADPASPFLTVREGGAVILSGAFDPANFTITVNPDGTSTLEFRVADELALRGLDPELSGGRVGPPAGATTADVTFDSVVQRFYADGRPLLQGDALGNQVAGGAVLPGSGNTIGDNDSSSVALDRGQALAKSVYLVNGQTPVSPTPNVTSDDTVTFRLQYTLPTGSANDFTLTDFLPLPVLLPNGSAGPLTFLDIRNDGSNPATLPPVGSAWFHPDETFDLNNPVGYAGTPTITLNVAANSITFDFGDFYMPTPQELKVDILFRLPIEDQPFGDNLTLTNLVTSREANTAGQVVTENAITQIIVTQPMLNITKGVISVETGQTTFPTSFDPTTVGPVPFNPPGTGGAPFLAPITSAALGASPIDSNLAGVDAGDLVRFALVVENTGSGIRGAHDILVRDTLPPGFEIPPGGLNLAVTRGDGLAIPFVLEGGGLFDPAGGIRLLDPSDADPANREGALTRLNAATAPTGSNLALITYDLRVADAAQSPALAMTNTTEITHYAAQEGGNDFAINLLPEERTDDATVTTGGPALDKILVSTSLPQSTDPFVLIGEEALFRVTLTLREGLTEDVLLSDLLPLSPGVLTLLDWRITGLGANLSFTGTAPPLNVAQTGPISINLGDVTNLADNVVDAGDQVTFEVRTLVANLPQNNDGDVLVNRATVTFADAAGAVQTLTDTDSVTIVEPGPQITKTADRTTGDGGDIITYTLQVTNPVRPGVSVPVFDMNIRDTFDDPDLSLVAGTVSISGTAAGTATIVLGNGASDTSIRIFTPQLDAGTVLTITYQGRISNTVESGKVVVNVAVAQGDSAPGDVPGQRQFTVTDNENVRINLPTLDKTVIATGLADTGSSQGNPALPDLAFGETITYRLRASFAEGTTTSVILRDLLPIVPAARLEALSATIVAVGSSITAPGAIVGALGALSDRSGDGVNDTVVFTIGTLVNAPDGVSDANDQIEVELTARLITSGSGTPGISVTNQGNLDFTSGGSARTLSATAVAETVAPSLAITKIPDRLRADGGDVVEYSVRLANVATSFAAPAYDLSLIDLIDDPDIELVAGSVAVSGAPATIIQGNAPGDTNVSVILGQLNPNQTLLVTYSARVVDFAVVGSQIVNTVDYDADSHPGVTPGEQAFSGAATANVRIGDVAADKIVSATSLTTTGTQQFRPGIDDVAIGETVTYLITETLPEGSTFFDVVDQLPTGTGVMEFLTYRILPLPATTNLDFVPGTEIATVTDSDGDGVNDRLALDFGTILNTPDNVTDQNDQIRIEVTARLIDRPQNIAGLGLTNTAQSFVNGVLVQTVTADIDVVEPSLLIGKSSDITSGDAGDIVTYRVTVAPDTLSGSGPAYGVLVGDLVPADLALIAGSVTTSRGAVLSGNGAADSNVLVALPVLLPGDAAVTITFQARMLDSVQPLQVITNTVDLDYMSAPGFARDYAGSANTSVVADLRPGITKTAVVTSLPETSFDFFDPGFFDVAVGESIIYEVVARLGEGTQTVVLDDLLPTDGSLNLLGAVVSRVGANIAGSALQVGDTGVVSGNTVSFDFGTVVNAGDNITDSRDEVAILVTARVRDVAVNVAGHQIVNTGEVTVGPTAGGSVVSVRDDATVEVVEPRLSIFKNADVTTGDAGDEVSWRLTVVNVPGASAPAYSLVLTDLVPAGMELVAGSVVTDRGVVTSGNAPGDANVVVDLAGVPLMPRDDQLTPGLDDTRVIVTYRTRLTDAVEPGQVLTNDASYAGLSAPLLIGGSDARPLTGSTSDSVVVDMPVALDKAIVATSLPETGSSFFDPANPDLAIGEEVTYHLTATLSEGTQTLVIADTLPSGLVFVSGRVVGVGAGLPPGLTTTPTVAGQSVTFDFGTVVNTGNNVAGDGTVTVEIVGRVADLVSNRPGVVLTNAGVATITSPTDASAPGGTQSATDSTSADIVGPEFDRVLGLVKGVDLRTGDAGDVFTYVVVLTPGPLSTGPAYDVLVLDTLDPVLVPISVNSSAGTASISGQTIRLEIPVLLPTAAPVVLTYQVRFADTLEPGQVVGNVADLGFNSAPGGGRPGTATASAPDLLGVFTLALAKAIVATSLPETGSSAFDPANPDLAIGEEVTYHLTATLSEGTQRLVIADALPAGLVFVSGRVVSVGAGLPPGLTTTPTVVGQNVVFDFGTVVNTGNNVAGDGTVVVEIIGRVADVPSNVAGHVLTNAGSAVVTSPTDPAAPGGTLTAADSTSADVVTPTLLLDKSTPPGFARPGEVISYTLTLTHAAGSSGPAYDLVLQDALTDANLDLVAGSVVASAGSVVIGNGAGDASIRVELGVLDLGQVLIVTFDAQVAAGAPAGGTVINASVAGYDTTPGPGGRPGTTGDTQSVPLAPGFVKVIDSTSLPETTDPEVNVGERITYRLTTTLPQGGIDDLVISDLLPAGLLPVSATVIAVGQAGSITGSGLAPGAAGIINGQQVRFEFGDVVNASGDAIDDADRIVVEIVAELLDLAGVTDGSTLSNDARVDYVIGGETGQDGSIVPVLVVEPAIGITKTVDHLTGDAGDVFTYTVTLTPGGTGPAYDLVVTDALDPVLFPVSVASTLGTASITGQTIRLEIPVLLPTDAPVVLTYQVRFADTVEPGRVVGNTASLAFDSAPGLGGRPDAGQASAPDLTAVFALDLTKDIVATSIPETRAGFFDPTLPDIAIGEAITYELVVTLSEGTQNLVLQDLIPDGLAFVPGSITIVAGAGISAGAGGTLAPTPVLAGTTATLDFGTLVNTGDNVSDAGDRVTVRFQAIALDDPLNVEGRLLMNTADGTAFSPTAPGAPGGTLTASDSADAEIVVVVLALDKTVTPGGGDAGDVFTYTLTLDHLAPPTSTAPAFLVLVLDPLPAPLVLDAGSITASFGTATAVGNTVRIEIPVLLPDDPPVVITYQARLSDAVEPGEVVTNLATVEYASSPGAISRPGADDASATINGVFTVALDKAIVATSLPETGSSAFDPANPDLAIGEEVTYHLTATLSEGTQTLVIADALPAGLVFVSGRVVSVGSGLAPGVTATPTVVGQNVVFDFGTVVNTGNNVAGDGTVVVEIIGRVADVPSNVAGHVLTNAGSVVVASPTDPAAPGGTETAAASTNADVVEPQFDLVKTVDQLTGDAGDVFVYTVTLTPQAGSTGPAYDVVITDVLDAVLFPVSVTASMGTATINGQTIRLEIPVLLPTDAPVVLTYQVRFTDAIEPGQVVGNVADLGFNSAPGGGRPGTDSASAPDLTGVFALTLDKAIIATSLPGTGSSFFDPANPDLAIGEVVTYRLVATLSEGTQRVLIADLLPEGLVPESASVAAVGAGLPPGLVATPGVIAGQSVRFDFGTVVNTGNNVAGDGTITIDVTARVSDIAINQAGRLLQNAAAATVLAPTLPGNPGGTLIADAGVGADVVVPVLAVTKVADRAFAGLGEEVTYTVTLVHQGGSTAPAYNVLVGDTLQGGVLRLVVGSVTTSLGSVLSGNGGGDTTVQVTVPELAIGQVVTVTFRAVPLGVPPATGEVPNTATFTADSAPDGPPGFIRVFNGDSTAVIRVTSGQPFGPGPSPFAAFDQLLELNRLRPSDQVLAPVYSGTATPGAAVTLVVRDGTGAITAQETRFADVGGNWLVSLPGLDRAPPPAPNTTTMLAASPIFADMAAQSVNAGLPEVTRSAAPQTVAGEGLRLTPQQQQLPVFGLDQAADNTRLYFAGPASPSTFAAGPLEPISGQGAGLAAIRPDAAAMARPFGLSLNKFAMEFLAGSTVPAGRLQ